jgi:conjugal transfer pilus assembly protein TraA
MSSITKRHTTPMLLALGLMVLGIGAAMAGSDTTFTSVYQTLEGWLVGSLGKILAVAMLAVGIGIGIARQSIMSVVLFFGVSLVVVNISAVIGLLFTGTL